MELGSRSPNVRYYCPPCVNDVSKFDDLQQQIQVLLEEVNKIKENIQTRPSYADALKKIESANAKISSEVKEIKSTQQKTITDFVEARRIVDSLGDQMKNAQPQQPTLEVEPAVREVQERELRKKNLIIFGIAEIVSSPRPERIALDLSKSKEVISSVDASIPLGNIACHRVGKYSPEKKRPIKVILENPEDAFKVIKQKSKLAGDIYIKTDMTKLQRDYLLKVTTQLKERQSAGEADIIIKYVRGVPTIVKKPKGLPKN